MNSLSNYKLFAIFVIRLCLFSHILVIIFINVNESMTLQCIFCTKNKFLQSGILIQSSSLDLIIGFLLFSYSALTIRIVRIVFGNQKMNEYEYRIPLFGPNYSNSRIVRIIRPNTVCHPAAVDPGPHPPPRLLIILFVGLLSRAGAHLCSNSIGCIMIYLCSINRCGQVCS